MYKRSGFASTQLESTRPDPNRLQMDDQKLESEEEELGEERSSSAASPEVCNTIRAAIRELQSDIDSDAAVGRSEVLLRAADFRTLYEKSDWDAIANAYDRFVDIYKAAWRARNTSHASRKVGNAQLEPIRKTHRNLSLCLRYLTDVSESICNETLREGVLGLLLGELNRLSSVGGAAYQQTVPPASTYLAIIFNLTLKLADAGDEVHKSRNLRTIRLYLQSLAQSYKIGGFLVASTVLHDSTSDKSILATLMSRDNVTLALNVLGNALRSPDHVFAADEFRVSADKLLVAYGRVANYSKQFAHLLLQLDAVEVLFSLLLAPAETGNSARYSTADEKSAAISCLWSLTFYDAGREAIKRHPGLMVFLRSLVSGNSPNSVKLAASGIIWQCSRRSSHWHAVRNRVESGKLRSLATPSPAGPNVGQRLVMISYCWSDQAAVLRIHEAMKSSGFSTWIDVEKMKGSTIEAMANALDAAAIVLICYSQDYFHSANCRAEAEYAFTMRKNIIPVRLQNYVATGWLGLILGTRLWYDFSDSSLFDSTFVRLCDAMRQALRSVELKSQSHGQSQRAADTGSVMTRRSTAPQKKTRKVIESWSAADVNAWLVRNGLSRPIAEKLTVLSGAQLLEIGRMERLAPGYLYKQIAIEFGLDFGELLDFLHVVRKLGSANDSSRS